MLRAVIDSNVVLAAHLTSAPRSPNREILSRWEAGEFVLLFSRDLLLEYIEKLVELEVDDATVRQLISSILRGGERVQIRFFHLRSYPVDADDICFVLCALNGKATHIVTYDGHLLEFVQHEQVKACEPLEFLRELRAA